MAGIKGDLCWRAIFAVLALGAAAIGAVAPRPAALVEDAAALTVPVDEAPPPIAASVRIKGVLPHEGRGPAQLSLSGDLRDPRGYVPAKLSELSLRLSRGLCFDVGDVPRCGLRALQRAPISPERNFDPATGPCPKAVVGKGTIEIDYSPPGSKPVIFTEKIAVLNGGTSGAQTRLYVFGQLPFLREALIAKVRIEPAREGPFGSLARISFPRFGDGFGYIRRFSIAIGSKRRNTGEGILMAACTTSFRNELTASFLDRPAWGPSRYASRCSRSKKALALEA